MERLHVRGRQTGFQVAVPSARLGAALLIGLCTVAGAAADTQTFNATQDQSVVSSFTLDFGVYGGPRTANITTSVYTLEADVTASTTRFLSYHQTVEPLELPGGISTGNMVVTIQDSAPGAYDPVQGTFATQDTYLIYFEGDLSAYGLTSPVALPGAAGGAIAYTSAVAGTITSSWAGQGELANPQDAAHPIAFNYTCQTQTTFTTTPEPTGLALLGIGMLFARRFRG
jgi:hypothetical protein